MAFLQTKAFKVKAEIVTLKLMLIFYVINGLLKYI
jgi:hypothetical protein